MKNSKWKLFKIIDGTEGKKPMDISGCSPGGIAVCCEVKVIPNSLRDMTAPIPRSEFSIHQNAWLDAYAEAGALGIPVIYDPVCTRLIAFILPRNKNDTLPKGLLRWFELKKSGTDRFIGWPDEL